MAYSDYYTWEDENFAMPWWTDQSAKERYTRTLNRMLKCGEYTPDLPELAKHETHNIFVYGTLMKGKRANGLMGQSTYFGPALTDSSDFFMKQTVGKTPYPVAFRANASTQEPRGYIKGHVYQCDVDTIVALDQFESNGYMYNRLRAKVILDDTKKAVDVWMYQGRPGLMKLEGVRSLPLCPSFTRKKTGKRYYNYTWPHKGQ